MAIEPNDALVVIDMQNDFCPGGALAVSNGDEIVELINRLAPEFSVRVFTQDWHPACHTSFASNQTGKSPFETIELAYGAQVLWPDHCIQGTYGAKFHGLLNTDLADIVIRKGVRPEIDSYSAFFENDRQTPTGLEGYLRARNAKRVFCAGLATDYCVYFSAMDACRLGFEVIVLEDCCRAIDMEGSLDTAYAGMERAGIQRVPSASIIG